MNTFRHQFLSVGSAVALAIALTPFGLAQFGNTRDVKLNYNKIFDIETQELKNYLNFPGSKLAPMILARVDMEKSKPGSKPQAYEHLWYRGSDPVGCRRHGQLEQMKLNSEDEVAIYLTHKGGNGSDAEIGAAADATMRLYLDLVEQSTTPAAVIVPQSSGDRFVRELQKFNFVPTELPKPNQPVQTSIVLQVITVPPTKTTYLFYQGRYF